MIFNYENKTLQVKIIYYGLAMSGNTTSIRSLFSYYKKKQFIKSIDNSVGSTLLFDFGGLQFQGIEWNLRLLIYSAIGQDLHANARPETLNRVDGLIFVVDSQIECLKHNIISWNELKTIFGSEFYKIPIVISVNKYDLSAQGNIVKNGFLSYIDFNRFRYISFEKTIAIEGKGVSDTFIELIKFFFPQLKINLSISN